MNKLLKELKTIAWDYACSKIPPNALGQKNHEDYFAEKFAELIIKECLDIIEDEAYNTTMLLSYPQQSGAIWDAKNNIKSHFGVK